MKLCQEIAKLKKYRWWIIVIVLLIIVIIALTACLVTNERNSPDKEGRYIQIQQW